MITTAPLQAEDREPWEALFAGYNAFYSRTWPAERYEQAWDEFRRDVRIHALGARLDGHLVGIAHFLVHASTTSADVCYLQDLFTDVGVRGQGVGRNLIEAVSDWARAHGCERLYWHTQHHNDTARRLYDHVANTVASSSTPGPCDARSRPLDRVARMDGPVPADTNTRVEGDHLAAGRSLTSHVARAEGTGNVRTGTTRRR